MKRFSVALLSSMFLFAAAGGAVAELIPIYGPVYIAKTKEKGEHHRKDTKLSFTAPVQGKGVLIVRNGGDSGKKARVSSAEIELNGIEIAERRDFNKKTAVLNFDVDLLATNEMEVEVRSCRECELEITVMGEKPAPPPTREAVAEPVPVREPVPLREPVL